MNADLWSLLQQLYTKQAHSWILYLQQEQLAQKVPSAVLRDLKQQLQVLEPARICRIYWEPAGVFLLFPRTRYDDMQAVLVKLKFMLGLTDDDDFYKVYQLDKDFDALAVLLQQKKQSVPSIQTEEKKMDLQAFTPQMFADLEKKLAQTDLSQFFRRQPICAIVKKSPPLELFDEIYIAVSDLLKECAPQADIFKTPWLFARLMESLDKSLLNTIKHHDNGAFMKNFSINLAVSSVMTPMFADFDASLPDHAKKTILVELKFTDILTDLPAFVQARQFLKERGYRLCIDLVSDDIMSFVQRQKLEADYIKLLWSSELLEKVKDQAFIEGIQRLNPQHIILCRVDDQMAIDIGQAMGITLFQGYYVQKMLYQTPKAQRLNHLK